MHRKVKWKNIGLPGVFQTCNHVAAALFRIKAAVRMGLSNPSCTSKPCKWLPNNAVVKPTKLKNRKLSRGDFGRRTKTKNELNCSLRKLFLPDVEKPCDLTFEDILSSMKEICVEEESIIFTAEAKTVQRTTVQPTVTKFQTHADMVAISMTGEDFIKNLSEK